MFGNYTGFEEVLSSVHIDQANRNATIRRFITLMKITRKDPFTGKTNTWDIPVTTAQLIKWEQGELIQNAMPNLTPDQREFIMTGITPASWDDAFGAADDSTDGVNDGYNI